MAPVFELLFDVYVRLLLQRSKICLIGSQKGNLKGSLCEFGEEKCKCMLFLLANSSHFRSELQSLSYTCLYALSVGFKT